MRDAVIIGGGHNGLVTAAFLAKAGLKPLVLERSDRVGGCAITADLAPGFTCPALAHHAALDPSIARALDLKRHGLSLLRSAARACAPTVDGRALTLWTEPSRAAADIGAFSTRDAAHYPEFLASIGAVAEMLRRVMSSAAPSVDARSPSELIELLALGRAFRRLGRPNGYRLLRWLPMAAADLVAEWFESEPLRATVAGVGVLGCFHGPRSAGSGAVLLMRAAQGDPIAPGGAIRGGPGALSGALAAAARAAGAEIRTGAEVTRILVQDGAAVGVLLANGEEIGARTVISNADPRRTLLGLVEPVHLDPDFIHRVQRIRMRGTLAKVNFAVSALPPFPGVKGPAADQRAALSGCVRLARSIDTIERAFDAAKYGQCSDEPWIELAVPSILDPDLAPAGAHVVSTYVQFAPYALRQPLPSAGARDAGAEAPIARANKSRAEPATPWGASRERFGDLVTAAIERYAPGFRSTIVARQVITPEDLERQHALTGGHIYHGELSLDQLLLARPLLGMGGHSTPIASLFLCGSGTHPGIGLDGRSGRLAAQAILQSQG